MTTRTLSGECIVVTGQTHQISRAQMRDAVEAAGGTLAGTISTETTILVIGGPAHVSAIKIKTARLLGVRMLSEAEFVALLTVG